MAGRLTRWSVWLGIGGLSWAVMAVSSDARADDRARQRTEARIITQSEKYEAWQEEVESELEELWRRAENLKQINRITQIRDRHKPFEDRYWAQWEKIDMTQKKGHRILSRIRQACQRIEERWPPAPPECQEELSEFQRFYNDTQTRQSELYPGG